MRALVTGATGFIGSFLTERLLRAGADVAVLIRPNASTWRIRHVLARVTRIDGDLHDLAPSEHQIRDFAPDTVFHLAWFGVAGRYRNDPRQLQRNLPGTLELLRLAHRVGCRTWIGLGSQAEYGPHSRTLAEDAPTRPTTTYGLVKLCTGLAAASLAERLGLRLAWLRMFSAYGPRDHPETMVSYLIRTLLAGDRPRLTACEQAWDYLYVEDAAEAVYQVAATPAARGVFNLGSGRCVRLRQVVERVHDAIDPALPVGIGALPYRPDEVMHLEADVTRLAAVTGWKPTTPLADGLHRTIAWHRDAEAGAP